AWHIGEEAARRRLESFLKNDAPLYAEQRDYPGLDATSRLSPHLHFGEISARQIWDAGMQASRRAQSEEARRGLDSFMRQLVWREFAAQLLWRFPHTAEAPLRDEYSRFPWEPDDRLLAAWQAGRTGFPLIDAG